MKRTFAIIIFSLLLYSCQTRVVSQDKPMRSNSVELYKKYTIQTLDAKEIKMEVLRQDEENLYGKNKKGEEIVLEKSQVREIKKVDLFSTFAIGLAAIAAVVFIPL